ncbi:MAG: hypothetical protein ACYS4W_08325 [Planctomycetota bacterium]|jgi:hypothetical protein
MEFDNYSSHLFVFERIFEAFEIKSVLEFGMGKYSTTFFAERCESVTSVEQESQEWYERMTGEINLPNWRHVFQPDPRVLFEEFDAANQRFDLVFSDGAAQTRSLAANLAMERNVPWVVLHDAEKVWYYRWNLLEIPFNYKRFNFRHRKGCQKVTTILTNNHASVLEEWVIAEHDRILQAYSSPSQPVFHLNYASLLGSISKRP